MVRRMSDGQRRLYALLRPEGLLGVERWPTPWRELWRSGPEGLAHHLDEGS